MVSPGVQLSMWITGLAGNSAVFDKLMSLLASNFFVPVTMSMVLLFLWFGPRDTFSRSKNQWGGLCVHQLPWGLPIWLCGFSIM